MLLSVSFPPCYRLPGHCAILVRGVSACGAWANSFDRQRNVVSVTIKLVTRPKDLARLKRKSEKLKQRARASMPLTYPHPHVPRLLIPQALSNHHHQALSRLANLYLGLRPRVLQNQYRSPIQPPNSAPLSCQKRQTSAHILHS